MKKIKLLLMLTTGIFVPFYSLDVFSAFPIPFFKAATSNYEVGQKLGGGTVSEVTRTSVTVNNGYTSTKFNVDANGEIIPSSGVSGLNTDVYLDTVTPGDVATEAGAAADAGGEAAGGAVMPGTGEYNADGSGVWNGSGWDPTGDGPVKLSPGEYGAGGEAAGGAGASGAGSGGSGATTAGTAVVPENVYSHNPVQYAIVILEGMEGRKTKEVSKEVSIKAQELQDSQGAQTASASMASEMSTRLSQERNPISATTIADASNAMIELLNMTKIDLNLLSTVVERQDEPAQVTPRGPAQVEAIGAAQEGAASSLSSSAASGTSSASGGSQRQTVLEGETTVVEQHETTPSGESPASDDDDTTYKKEQIRKRRAMMLAEWAIAATQIGEGSNAISNQFYERAEAFVEAANEAAGSLGGMSAINDTDRFVLFELTRGGALSAVQLGLQGATNLNELEDES